MQNQNINSTVLKKKKLLTTFKINLEKLKNQLNKFDIKPIFITQIKYDINGQEVLYLLNEELKEFSKKNDYHIIKLDELINYPFK